MLRLSANISTLFTEASLLERPALAAKAGFAAIEVQFPYSVPAADFAGAAQDAGVEVVLINVPAGDLAAGDLGLACLPHRRREFLEAVEIAADYALAVRCPRVNCLAGNLPDPDARVRCWDMLVENILYAANAFQVRGVQLLTEALNRADCPSFMLTSLEEWDELLKAAPHSNLALQYDVYHRRASNEDWLGQIAPRLDRIGHIQFSDFPGRHEPGSGGMALNEFFALMRRLPYEGWTGAEYRPSGATEDSFGWMSRLPA